MISRSNRITRLAARLAGVALVGILAAACGSGGGSANAPSGGAAPASGSGSTTTTTTVPSSTATTLPACGAARDPLDPTDAGPPAGSPATC